MIKSKKLSKIKTIRHGFFNKVGGKSKKIYKSLNCGHGSKDNLSDVKKNLQIVKKKIKSTAKNIFLLHQIHSNKFVYINKKNIFKTKPKADAVITNQKNIPIGILTADCVPILICDEKTKLVAAIHAGWKGAFKGIIQNVLKFMFKKGCSSKNLTVAIGPCISHKSYEVQDNFREKFVKKDKRNKIFFTYINKRIYFNLPNYVKTQLKLYKINKIDFLNKDTFLKKNNYFSARQSIKLKHNDYGRNISIIVIN